MFVQHCQGCLIGRNVGDFGGNWRHMTTQAQQHKALWVVVVVMKIKIK
jgi:hypothetical protein